MGEVLTDMYIAAIDEKEELLKVVREAESVILMFEMSGRGLGTGPGSIFQLKRAVQEYRRRHS